MDTFSGILDTGPRVHWPAQTLEITASVSSVAPGSLQRRRVHGKPKRPELSLDVTPVAIVEMSIRLCFLDLQDYQLVSIAQRAAVAPRPEEALEAGP